MRNILLSSTLVAAALPAAAALTGQWFTHPSFDNSVVKVIDTPTRTYFMGYPMTVQPSIPVKSSTDCSLFYFDKEGEEIVSVPQRHDISSPLVRTIDYNPQKGYLLITYDNQDIDFLFDDGSVKNVGALKNASITGSKTINSVYFDPYNDAVWIATDFGYIQLNDERMEVSDSRNYGEKIDMVARVGDDIYISDGDNIMKAPLKDGRRSLADYAAAPGFNAATTFYVLGESTVMAWIPGDNPHGRIVSYNVGGSGLSQIEERDIDYIYRVLPCKAGYSAISYGSITNMTYDEGKLQFIALPDDEKGQHVGSGWDRNFYNARPRKGLREYTLNADKKYEVTREYMLPNAPTPFYSRSMVAHPRHGLLTNSFGIDRVFNLNELTEMFLISSYKGGFWTPLSYCYTNAHYTNAAIDPVGMAIDPDDDRYLYVGSIQGGIVRMNLDDRYDVICFSHPGDPIAEKPGFVKLDDTSEGWARMFPHIDPQFDKDKTLWTYHYDYDNRDKVVFRYWPAEARRATADAASARPWKKLEYTVSDMPHIHGKFLALTGSVNRNMLLYMGPYGLFVVDHNGTPDNTSDDKVATITKVTDQDGNSISNSAANYLYEDPQTGVVWICNAEGIFYVTPRNLLQGQAVFNRVKVSRNDGTSLADYLLNGVTVNAICRDASNRMWIATTGGGVIVTSADGRQVYAEFSAENSGLPSNTIYCLAYNPDNNSIMMSTPKGLTEFFIGGSVDGSGSSDSVRAYPNPVAPDYYGWVTIDGLPDNSLVKIVDSRGTIVRELGRAEGGSVQWDVNNLQYKRVQTGVYYILVSPTSESGGETRVGKVLVMN